MHTDTFMPDAPTYPAQLRLSSAELNAGISGEPEIIARHKACLQKGFSALNKPELTEPSSVENVRLQRSRSWELSVLDKVLTCVETRPRIGSRSSGFRVNPDSYKHLIYVLTCRKRTAKDGFTMNGKKSPSIPSWANTYHRDEFYSLPDFEILAVCFRAEVEHFLLRLCQVFDFERRRPILKENRAYTLFLARQYGIELPGLGNDIASEHRVSEVTCARQSLSILGSPKSDLRARHNLSVPSSESALSSTLAAPCESNDTFLNPNHTEGYLEPPSVRNLSADSIANSTMKAEGLLHPSMREGLVDEAECGKHAVQMLQPVHTVDVDSVKPGLPAGVADSLSSSKVPVVSEIAPLIPGSPGTATNSVRCSFRTGTGTEHSPGLKQYPRHRLAQGIG
ncbi:hypothetical protein DFH06DRAFT_1447501 [Mycena polygramma]|nr:hypothetical protein DFH06DRAFT_1447501 [Mycena polygramma]